VWEFVWLLVLVGAIVVLAAPWLMRRRQPGDALQGTFLITGVSPKADTPGEQFVTVTGVINGPNVDEHVVYQQWSVNADGVDWPKIGDLVPVVYSARNPDNWRVAPPEAPA
jgi:hypothetical protein